MSANDIGWAVKQMRHGDKVRRAGWNGKGMWLRLEGERTLTDGSAPDIDDRKGRYLPFVLMKTAQGEFVPWLCSQTDLLAIDWEIAS